MANLLDYILPSDISKAIKTLIPIVSATMKLLTSTNPIIFAIAALTILNAVSKLYSYCDGNGGRNGGSGSRKDASPNVDENNRDNEDRIVERNSRRDSSRGDDKDEKSSSCVDGTTDAILNENSLSNNISSRISQSEGEGESILVPSSNLSKTSLPLEQIQAFDSRLDTVYQSIQEQLQEIRTTLNTEQFGSEPNLKQNAQSIPCIAEAAPLIKYASRNWQGLFSDTADFLKHAGTVSSLGIMTTKPQNIVSQGFNLLGLMCSAQLRTSLLSKRALQSLNKDVQDMKRLLSTLYHANVDELMEMMREYEIKPETEVQDFLLPSKSFSHDGDGSNIGAQTQLDPFAFTFDKYIMEPASQHIGVERKSPVIGADPSDQQFDQEEFTTLEGASSVQSNPVLENDFDIELDTFSFEDILQNMYVGEKASSSAIFKDVLANSDLKKMRARKQPPLPTTNVPGRDSSKLDPDALPKVPDDALISIAPINPQGQVHKTQLDLSVDLKEALKKCNVVDLYKGKPSNKRQYVPAIADPVVLNPDAGKLGKKWGYQRLAETKSIIKFTNLVLKHFRALHERLHEGTDERHEFEWCILVDDSGSMSPFSNQSAEALVIMIEVLRKLECRFAVARFGAKNDKRPLLKNLEMPFDAALGQQILESFQYRHGTYMSTSLARVIEKTWDKQVEQMSPEERRTKHRIVIMITDAYTQEKNISEYRELTERYGLNLGGLLIRRSSKDGDIVNNMDSMEVLMKEISTNKLMVRLDASNIDELPTVLAKLMSDHFKYVLENKILATTTRTPSQLSIKLKDLHAKDTLQSFLPIKDIVQAMKAEDVEKLMQQGAGGRTRLLYQHSGSDSSILADHNLADLEDNNEIIERRREVLAKSIEQLRQYMEELQSNKTLETVILDAEDQWSSAQSQVADDVNQLSSVLEDYVLPQNKFTRRRADYKGSTLDLPGLIKAVSTDFAYKKFFSTKSAGGKRDYGIVFAIDVSLSMRGHLANCVVESLLIFIASMMKIGIENFSIVLFGDCVKVVKTETQQWDSLSIFTLLNNLRFDEQFGTFDAHGIEVALDLLAQSGTRGSKKVFVFTDGYGSNGQMLTRVLKRAENEDVDVVAMSVGFDKSFVSKCYKTWAIAAMPSALGSALQGIYEGEEPLVDIRSNDEWSAFLPAVAGAAETTSDVFHNIDLEVFKKSMLDDRKTEIIIHVGEAPIVSVDIAIVIDQTGSMKSWLQEIKGEIGLLVNGIEPAVKKQFGITELKLRFALVAYRDVGDDEHLKMVTDFVDDKKVFIKAINSLVAIGGADGPEDVLGGINHAINRLTWGIDNAKFLVLVGDAPAHGRDCNNDSSDRFPDGNVGGHTVLSVMQAMRRMDIEFMFCTANPEYTLRMLRQFETHYNNVEDAKTLTYVDLTDGKTHNKGFHFIFVLDESGSMRGTSWNHLSEAYDWFIQSRRNDQGFNDLVSVVQFNGSSRVIFQNASISSCSRLGGMKGGDTNFIAGLNIADPLVRSTPSTHAPIIMFMSDGGHCSGGDPTSTVRTMYSAYRSKGLCLHTIFFGSSKSGHPLLQSMAQAGGGSYYTAVNNVTLAEVFTSIAANSKTTDVLASKLGSKISSQIANKIVLDFL